MSRLADTMTLYAAYHQDHRNRLTHFFGVPIIVFSVFVFLSYLQLDVAGVAVTGAMIFIAVFGAYYVRLDAMIGLVLLVLLTPMAWVAHQIATLDPLIGLSFATAAFIIGWVIQLVGHSIEGNKPALLKGLWQMAMAPLFLCAEAMFMMGFRKELEAEVNAGVAAYIALHGKPGQAAHA